MRRASIAVVASAFTLGAGCGEIERLTQSEKNERRASRITLRADTSTVPVGGSTTIHVGVLTADGGPVRDGTRVEMTATLGRIEPADVRTQGGEAHVGYHAGPRAGSERISAVAGDARAELDLTVGGGGPAGSSSPEVSSPAEAGLDLRQVIWLDPDVSGWPESSRVTSASIGDPPICIHHTKAGQWPVKDGLEGNPWIFVNLDGRWYGATFEWLAPGQQCKAIHRDNIGEHIGRAPLSRWRPRSGELVGLMVSARARFHADTVRERSNVVMLRWP